MNNPVIIEASSIRASMKKLKVIHHVFFKGVYHTQECMSVSFNEIVGYFKEIVFIDLEFLLDHLENVIINESFSGSNELKRYIRILFIVFEKGIEGLKEDVSEDDLINAMREIVFIDFNYLMGHVAALMTVYKDILHESQEEELIEKSCDLNIN